MNGKALNIILLLAVLCTFCNLSAQTPFASNGQVYMLDENGRSLIELKIDPGNNALSFEAVSPDYGMQLDALGMRRTDNFLYAINVGTNGVYRLDQSGGIELVGFPNLNANEEHRAGDFTSDGRYFVVIGSIGSKDVSINRIDLSVASLPVTRVDIPAGNINLSDISSDPSTSLFYGYDKNERRLVKFSPTAPNFSGFVETDNENEIFGLYFDAFGVLRAYGSTVSGIVSGLFEMPLDNGQEQRISTGPLVLISDMASSPYNVAVASIPDPQTTFPCSKVLFKYTVANRTGQELSGLTFSSNLPQGLLYSDVISNPFGGNIAASAGDGQWAINNITLPEGERDLTIELEVADVDAGEYFCSAKITGLPTNLGGEAISDDLRTLARFDPSRLRVVKIEEDTIFNSYLICEGTSIELSTDGYGGNIEWFDGSTDTERTVSNGGIYSFDASSDCQVVHVQNAVTVASCPFTVEIGMDVFPMSTFKCSEVLFHYILENDSGDDRPGVGVVDTLPSGFSFIEVVRNPFGGDQVLGPDPQIIQFENMSLNAGKDTMTLRVFVGDVQPKTYNLRSKLINLPSEIGTFRLSDDPKTVILDSTAFQVLGTGTDSLVIELPLCSGDELELNAGPYGTDYLWFDGDRDSSKIVTSSGYYDLDLFNGCDSVYVGFDVTDAPDIDLSGITTYYIFQGDSIQLSPTLSNESDSIFMEWTDPLDTTLSCFYCLMPVSNSLFSIDYLLSVNNEICSDSAVVRLEVDNTRTIYAPNIFSPNGDFINDNFSIASPNYAFIEKFQILDRWGNILYRKDNVPIAELYETWDGTANGRRLPPGVYLWYAQIRFIDQTVESFSGDITLLR